jgi:hypothetical protein
MSFRFTKLEPHDLDWQTDMPALDLRDYGPVLCRSHFIPGSYKETVLRGDYWMLDLRWGNDRWLLYREHNWLAESDRRYRQVGVWVRRGGLFEARWRLCIKAWDKTRYIDRPSIKNRLS